MCVIFNPGGGANLTASRQAPPKERVAAHLFVFSQLLTRCWCVCVCVCFTGLGQLNSDPPLVHGSPEERAAAHLFMLLALLTNCMTYDTSCI